MLGYRDRRPTPWSRPNDINIQADGAIWSLNSNAILFVSSGRMVSHNDRVLLFKLSHAYIPVNYLMHFTRIHCS